jgi:hypothetical protein
MIPQLLIPLRLLIWSSCSLHSLCPSTLVASHLGPTRGMLHSSRGLLYYSLSFVLDGRMASRSCAVEAAPARSLTLHPSHIGRRGSMHAEGRSHILGNTHWCLPSIPGVHRVQSRMAPRWPSIEYGDTLMRKTPRSILGTAACACSHGPRPVNPHTASHMATRPITRLG